jgi:hypothetical protein
MQAYTHQAVTLAFSGDTRFATVELWTETLTASSSPADHANHVSGGIEKLVKKFITDWNLDNKPDITGGVRR